MARGDDRFRRLRPPSGDPGSGRTADLFAHYGITLEARRTDEVTPLDATECPRCGWFVPQTVASDGCPLCGAPVAR